jgi:hypothetical protein
LSSREKARGQKGADRGYLYSLLPNAERDRGMRMLTHPFQPLQREKGREKARGQKGADPGYLYSLLTERRKRQGNAHANTSVPTAVTREKPAVRKALTPATSTACWQRAKIH